MRDCMAPRASPNRWALEAIMKPSGGYGGHYGMDDHETHEVADTKPAE